MVSVVRNFVSFLVPLVHFVREEPKFTFTSFSLVWVRAVTFLFFVRWLFSLMGDVGSYFFVVLVVVAIWLNIDFKKSVKKKAVEFLEYLAVIIYGFGSIWSFFGHFFFAEQVAASIGWVSNQFQTELAFVHLGFGIVGILAIWFRKAFVPGLVIAKSVFLFGAGYVHIVDIFRFGNFNPGNAGSILVFDVVYPVVFLLLLWVAREAYFKADA